MMIEDMGHRFVGSTESFADLQNHVDPSAIDCALVDIDLCDGATGPQAVAWLAANGIPSAFVTGQELTAEQHSSGVVCTIGKPVTAPSLATSLAALARALDGNRTTSHCRDSIPLVQTSETTPALR
ncbi:hypothetical protein GGQ62_002321 [Polymorphobacter fuscus]|nr:hypothetical protein [Polymorphobacter fuscus]